MHCNIGSSVNGQRCVQSHGDNGLGLAHNDTLVSGASHSSASHSVLVTPVPVTVHSCHIGSSANKSLCCEASSQ
eukprot:4363824-Amphidinium_carterae.2